MKVTLGQQDYDVFADVTFADRYLAGDVLRAVPWALRQDDSKARGLISATRAMLALPWGTAPDPTASEIDPVLSQVCAMLASDLLTKPKLFADASGDSNVKIAKAGSAQVEFFRPVTGGPPLPLALWNMLVNAGLIGTTGDASDTDPNGGVYVGGLNACNPRPWDGRYADYDREGYLAQDYD